ncbi:MAG: glycosyltransferase family 2 protein [Nitrospinae bacterium]|nr:glycosyltransferase family 2 protein [Nitrospinota bacterium]
METNLPEIQISVVVPLFNEEPNLIPLYESTKKALEGIGRPWEIIFVDDGSNDEGPGILAGLAGKDPCVRVLTFRKNAGQTAAFDAGFKRAVGKYVVTMDADLQNDPADIPKLLALIDEGDCELVCGWRHRRNDPLVKRVSSKIANYVRNKLSDENIHDTGCSLKIFQREALVQIRLFNGMHRFFPTLMKMHGFRVREAKVNHLPRKFGKSKYGISNRVLRSFIDLLAVRWMKNRHLRYAIAQHGRNQK